MVIIHQITRVDAYAGQVPVRLRFSYGRQDTLASTIIRLTAANGAAGVGEVIVPPNDFIFAFLPTLLGRDARHLDQLLPATANNHDRILGEAVSIALHDLVGRISGLPVCALLGGRKDDTVPLMPCIFPETPDEAAEKAQFWFARGHRYLKTKLVGDFDEDLARIRAIRSVATGGVTLQADANEGYKTLDDARRAVRAFGEAGLDIFEDPLKGGPDDYARLVGAGRAKVMIDVLSRRTEDLLACLQRRAAEVVGIHPDQPGSLTKALAHARLAQAFGVPVVIGGTGYTGIGSAAYQHLTAVATPGGPCGELGGAFDHGMPRGSVKSPLPMAEGAVRIPDTPGLGVELDDTFLIEFHPLRRSWTL